VITLDEIEKSAMLLPEKQRALLASHLLGSLPHVLSDDDEGVSEALRRDAELDSDPSTGMSMAEFRAAYEG
jgi:hypothetical protein